MLRLLEEGLDRLKISVDVASASPDPQFHGGHVTVPPGHGAGTPTVPLSTATLQCHEMMGPPVLAHPNRTITLGPNPATENQSPFRKLDEIIRELTKKTKTSAKPEDLISLTLLSDYNILRERLRIDGDPTPDKTASLQIASCKPSQRENRLTKKPWFARRVREMANHVLKH